MPGALHAGRQTKLRSPLGLKSPAVDCTPMLSSVSETAAPAKRLAR
jgi:hypothetical protein